MDWSAVIREAATVILGGIGGAAVVVWGLSGFLSKVWVNRLLEGDRARFARELEELKTNYQRELEQIKSDLEAQRRAVQSQLDRSSHVHRLQFEKEFAALAEVWQRIAELRAVFPEPSFRKRDIADDEPYVARIEDQVTPKFAALVNSVDNQSPFYPKDIYGACSEAIDVARVVRTLALSENPRDVGDYFKVLNA